ncbi:Threonine/homoserine/homoserine lactone efflux protein [Rhizobium lusitanum]|uniref:Threonine/homoserine/homoserine lactone efflux protein n=2 Tax=Rhizobium/Agrobacterium group TaxID=227290 RepID=A0A1C3X2V6_9HYPH|nr:Threonine/homoserine/homoserine lactone efflux protein [Rhizobium lusitanum]
MKFAPTFCENVLNIARMTDSVVLAPFLVFAFLMTLAPGPNNAMALASGVRVGLTRSFPLIGGIAAGVAVQMLAIGFGLGKLFEAYPVTHEILRIGGSLYLIWLAWKIARSGPIVEDAESSPIGFLGAAAFQWINPKAWAITVSAAATYIPSSDYLLNISIAAALLAFVAIPSVAVWAAAGRLLRNVLTRPTYARVFNLSVALLLVGSTVPILLGNL